MEFNVLVFNSMSVETKTKSDFNTHGGLRITYPSIFFKDFPITTSNYNIGGLEKGNYIRPTRFDNMEIRISILNEIARRIQLSNIQ